MGTNQKGQGVSRSRLIEMYNETARQLNNATTQALKRLPPEDHHSFLRSIGWTKDRIKSAQLPE